MLVCILMYVIYTLLSLYVSAKKVEEWNSDSSNICIYYIILYILRIYAEHRWVQGVPALPR